MLEKGVLAVFSGFMSINEHLAIELYNINPYTENIIT